MLEGEGYPDTQHAIATLEYCEQQQQQQEEQEEEEEEEEEEQEETMYARVRKRRRFR